MYDLLLGVNNHSFFDSLWTVVHFLSGLAVGSWLMLWRRESGKPVIARAYARNGIILLLVWEYFELMLRYLKRYDARLIYFFESFLPHSFIEIESVTNVVSDLLIGALGLYAAFLLWTGLWSRGRRK